MSGHKNALPLRAQVVEAGVRAVLAEPKDAALHAALEEAAAELGAKLVRAEGARATTDYSVRAGRYISFSTPALRLWVYSFGCSRLQYD